MLIIPVDDSLIPGLQSVLIDEDTEFNVFLSKARQPIRKESTLYNDSNIFLKDGGQRFTASQDKIKGYTVLTTQKRFRSQHALVQYTAVNFRSDVCTAIQFSTPCNEITNESQLASLKRAIKHLQSTSTQGFDFAKLDMSYMRVVVLSDTSFVNALGLKSMFGYVILLAKKEQNADIVHYLASRCHRDTRSLIEAEVHVSIYAVNVGKIRILHDLLNELLNDSIGMKEFVDS